MPPPPPPPQKGDPTLAIYINIFNPFYYIATIIYSIQAKSVIAHQVWVFIFYISCIYLLCVLRYTVLIMGDLKKGYNYF